MPYVPQPYDARLDEALIASDMVPGDGIIIDGVPGSGVDPFASLIAAGTGIDVAYDSGDRQWTITNTGGGGGGGGGANLSVSTTSTTVVIASDTGTDATLSTASGTVAGIMTAAQFTKLSGIATGATANDTDANLRARSSHTGTQAWSTLTSTPTTLAGYGIVDAAAATHAHAGADITSGTVDPARLGSGTSITTKFLRGDSTWQTISGGGDALTTNPLSQFAATTSLQLAGVISDETGTGALVFANTPTLVTPILGTPTSGTLTNCTGYPYASLSGTPSTFTPSSHNHAASEITSGSLAVAQGGTALTALGAAHTVLRTNHAANALEYASGVKLLGQSPTIAYDGNNRVSTLTYSDGSVKTLTYTGSQLTQSDHVYTSPARTYRKVFAYTGSNLTSVTESIV